MNLTVTMRDKNRSFKRVVLFYAGFSWLRIWLWPFTGRRWSVLINRDEVIQVDVTKKLILDESNTTIKVV